MEKENITKLILSGLIGGALALGGSFLYQSLNPTTNSTASSTPTQVSSLSVKTKSDVTSAIKKVSGAIVSVLNYQKQNSSDFFDQIFGNKNSAANNVLSLAASGSGVIYKKDAKNAYVVTNNHVIAQQDALEVQMSGGQKVSASLVGADTYTDLAVLKIDAKYVKQIASFGDSSKLTIGEPAIALGSPLGSAFANSATEGIVSAYNRQVRMHNKQGQTVSINAIQTDAAINPGNSGGALLNIAGQVIGITSSKLSLTPEDGKPIEGMGFAIPAKDVITIINQLEKNGKIIRPALGITMIDLSQIPASQTEKFKLPDNLAGGVVVASIQKEMPAAVAGLAVGDVITEINKTETTSGTDLQSVLYNVSIGDRIDVTFYRDGKRHQAKLKLDKSSSEMQAKLEN